MICHLRGDAICQLVELRVDELEDWNDLIAVLRDRLLPAIVTCRPTWEGGHSEHDRLLDQ